MTDQQPEQQPQAEMRLISSHAPAQDIHGGEGSRLHTLLRKAAKLAEGGDTNSGISAGTKTHLIDKIAARELRDFNATHSICLDAKEASSVGLGHRELHIHEVLDPLTRFSWQDTLNALVVDYWETGECFLEVAFESSKSRKITGLFHLESSQVEVVVEQENSSELFHYTVNGETGAGETTVMARWDGLVELRKRFDQPDVEDDKDGAKGEASLEQINRPANRATTSDASARSGTIVNSEIIHIRQSTNRSRYYGYPDYMSAVPSIELVQCMAQHEFDFYFNRGVPEFILFLLGKNIGGCFEKIEQLIQANQGVGNTRKTGVVSIPGDPAETKVQIEKLAMEEGGNDGFDKKSATLDMRIATAHGMPPQLANIALPGKIGGANEGPNAMLTFQMRKLGQAQKNFSRMLACTLGGDVTFGQPGSADASLKAEEFLAKGAKSEDDNGMPQFVQPGNGFNTILDGMTLGAAETLNTMREPLAGSGRDVGAGKLGGARDRGAQDPKKRPSTE